MSRNALANPSARWRDELALWRKSLEARAPEGWSVPRLMAQAHELIVSNRRLAEADSRTVIGAVLECATLGLVPGGSLGQAYFVPFKGKCQLIVGYKGLVTLAVRSGVVASISANVVFERDAFRFREGTGAFVDHQRSLEADRGDPIAVYAVAVMGNGATTQVIMSVAEVNAIRDDSQGYKYAEKGRKDSPWHLHWPEMAKKTAIRRLVKSLPLVIDDNSTGLVRAMNLDDHVQAGTDQGLDDIPDADFEEKPKNELDEMTEAVSGGE